ncbi:MAG: protein kinase domain-containing protein [Promethearchaeota archaeon]
MPIKVGEPIIIDGISFSIERLIDHGGLSTVFLGINQNTKEKVAIKEFIYHKFYDKITRENDIDDFFDNEVLNTQIQAQSGFKTVNVLHYEKKLDLETPEYYIVFSYIEGKTFLEFYREFVQSCRGLANLDLSSIVRYIFLPLVDLLSYCHTEANIVHRDFSVKNIIIQTGEEEEFWPILIDWGVSKYVGPEWIYYCPKPYMTSDLPLDIPINQKGAPPEIKFGYMPNAASDIYYLAHLMYFTFSGGIMREDSEIISQESYVLDPRQVNWFVPVEYNEVVKKLTQYEPADRPQSMLEVRKMLEELINIQHVHFDFEFFMEHPDTDEDTGLPIEIKSEIEPDGETEAKSSGESSS